MGYPHDGRCAFSQEARKRPHLLSQSQGKFCIRMSGADRTSSCWKSMFPLDCQNYAN